MIMKSDFIQLSVPYQKLYKLIDTIDSIQLRDWTIMHSLAYICSEYKNKFDSDFVLSHDGTPSKCHEYKLCSRIWAMMQAKATEGEKVKNYIDWFFANYSSKKAFRSIGALSKVEIMSKYLHQTKEENIIKMNSILPQKFLDIAAQHNETSYIKTYGDVFFLKKAVDEGYISQAFNDMLFSLKTNGFDLSLLDKIS